MESLSLTTTTTTNTSKFKFSIPCYKNPKIYRNLPFHHKRHRKFILFAAKAEDNFDSYDEMELKFGKLIGEDPKLTLAKIMGRKTYPELSYLEIEKLYNKKGNKFINSDIEEVPFDVSDLRKKPNDSLDGLNLTRPVPVPKKEVKFGTNDSLDGLNLTRPVPKKGVKFETNDKSVIPKVKRPNQPLAKAPDNPMPAVPNVEIRKPTTFKEDDGLTSMLPRPNLSFKFNNSNKEDKERFTDMTMVRKPAPFLQNEETEIVDNETQNESEIQFQTDVSLLQKPEITVDQDFKDQSESKSEIDETKNNSRNIDLAFEMENVAKFDVDPLEENDQLRGNVSNQMGQIMFLAKRGTGQMGQTWWKPHKVSF